MNTTTKAYIIKVMKSKTLVGFVGFNGVEYKLVKNICFASIFDEDPSKFIGYLQSECENLDDKTLVVKKIEI